ncbi:hypothetical protein ASF98_11150 [Arthrobacter sp. Leaf337]|uniref:hypothetical protein n=1 Tax=Arthrobacter sp. Leaf337 TaxID=1736342 RepID=UPI0006F21281|nr:hypothetical protein [Arthrobacter sp. Leaf337]KQR64063.1 hypothetical protein ASF98_11150 [Arthrobacter sp. Leaf337]
MTASTITITTVLTRHDVPARFDQDPELRAIAYSLHRLENPAEGPEARFHAASSLLSGDTPEDGEYFMENRVLLKEIYADQLSQRLAALEDLED